MFRQHRLNSASVQHVQAFEGFLQGKLLSVSGPTYSDRWSRSIRGRGTAIPLLRLLDDLVGVLMHPLGPIVLHPSLAVVHHPRGWVHAYEENNNYQDTIFL